MKDDRERKRLQRSALLLEVVDRVTSLVRDHGPLRPYSSLCLGS